MKTYVILFALLGTAFSEVEKYVNNATDPCEMMTVDATFVTTASEDGQQPISKTLTTGADATSASGTCPGDTLSTLTITFNDTQAKWTLTFTKLPNNTVSLNMLFHYKPSSVFPTIEETNEVILDDKGTTILSHDTKSYVCNSEDVFTFSAPTAGNYSFTATLTWRNLQVQAFGLENATFSDAEKCAADEQSTTEPTTSVETTETTEPGTTETSGPTETTTPRPTPVPNYNVTSDNNTVCLILQATIVIKVDYKKKDNTTVTKEITLPAEPETKVTGSCAENTNKANISLEHDKDQLVLSFEDVDSTSQISEVELSVYLDSTRFPDAAEVNTTLELKATDLGIGKAKDTTYYKCNAGETVHFPDDETTVILTSLKEQAFNVIGEFSNEETECAADKSSSSMSTSTSAPKTTTAPGQPVTNHFTLSNQFGNVTCITMDTSLKLEIPYMSTSGPKTKIVDVPKLNGTAVSGDCFNATSDREELTITFFDDWTITFLFMISSDGLMLAADTNQKYDLSNVTFNYKIDTTNFPDTNETKSVETQGKFSLSANQDEYYQCNADIEVAAENGLKLTTSNLKFMAFQTTNSTTFPSNGQECPADTETNSVVPIAVGAALAGLVVIVLIAYLIGRRKSRRQGYESV